MKKRLLFSFFNALIAIFIFFLIQKIYLLPTNDKNVFTNSFITKHIILNKNTGINSDELLFVNTSFDNMLVDNFDEKGLPVGNINITDRKELQYFFERVKKSAKHKYILCDIFFEHASLYDDSLEEAMNIPRLIIPEAKKGDGLIFSNNKIKRGLAEIKTTGGLFYKYKLFSQETKQSSIPLKMYEELTGESLEKGYLWSRHGNNLMFNDFIPDYRVTNYDLLEAKSFLLFNLGEINLTSTEFFNSVIDNRIIVIGDFYLNDNKNTLLGNISGPLLLVNAYYSLVKGDNIISVWLIIFLFLVFWGFSFIAVYPQDILEMKIGRIPYFGILLHVFSYVLIMSLVSFLVYFIFGINVNLAYIGALFFIEDKVLNFKFYREKISQFFKQEFLKSGSYSK
ncbi:hypothetical protein WJR50_20550 [Catalinimonas sp. 4WD22]|uniref:hypothetical protein n=1 Tax=Catalinimonas locisalis TaxID=3133978 RepID=UPI003100E90A